jgi:adenosylcobyric acid synthase
MSANAIMVQGTASHAGKSVVVAALCRLYARAGYRVAPFKAQNMSNNSFVTADGGEMGRAQVFQAQAAGLEPHVDMNPILLKPDADTRAQVIRLGKPVGPMEVREYHDYQNLAWPAVTSAYDRLKAEYDLIVLEGAGSPAEINLMDRDIVNMKMADYAGADVILVGDIERGGVFASIIGTWQLLPQEHRDRLKGYLINKFRGDPSLLDPGFDFLERETNVPVLGVLPYVFGLPVDEEDAVVLDTKRTIGHGPLQIGVIHLPHISNATDFQAIASEPDVSIRYIESSVDFGEPDLVIIPGTKSTVSDYEWMQRQGLVSEVLAHELSGGWIVGICGGYQMMGESIEDPEQVESAQGIEGLKLLPVTTVFEQRKRLVRVEATCCIPALEGEPVRGYEIHQGRTEIHGRAGPAFHLTREFGSSINQADGAAKGLECFGTYIHGLFDHGHFRRAYLNALRHKKGLDGLPPHAYDTRPKDFDQLADWLLDGVDRILLEQVVGLPLEKPKTDRKGK